MAGTDFAQVNKDVGEIAGDSTCQLAIIPYFHVILYDHYHSLFVYSYLFFILFSSSLILFYTKKSLTDKTKILISLKSLHFFILQNAQSL